MDKLLIGFKTNRPFAIYTILAVLLFTTALAAPLIAPYNPIDATLQNAFQPPSAEHLFGTDKLGRDCFSRILYGAKYSLTSVLALVTSVFIIGTSLGVISGYFGGKIDIVIMRISDIMISFPGMILAIAVAGIMGGSLTNAFTSYKSFK